MVDQVTFIEGKNQLLLPGGGLPATSVFLLSSKPIAFDLANPVFGDLYAGSDWSTIGEITGWTGGSSPYARKSLATPTPTNGIVTYQTLPDPLWSVGQSTDGPASVPSLVLADPTNSKAFHAWDLRPLRQTTTVGSQDLPLPTINVVDTSMFENSGTVWINGKQITYTGKTSTALTGCSGGTGTVAAGTPVLQAPDMSKQNAQIQVGDSAGRPLRIFLQEP